MLQDDIHVEVFDSESGLLKVNGGWYAKFAHSSRQIFRVRAAGRFFIVKLENLASKLQQNKTEEELYKRVLPAHKKYFVETYKRGLVPVINQHITASPSDLSYLVTDYVEHDPKERVSRDKEETLKNLASYYGLMDVVGFTTTEVSQNYNVCVDRTGTLRIIDGGF